MKSDDSDKRYKYSQALPEGSLEISNSVGLVLSALVLSPFRLTSAVFFNITILPEKEIKRYYNVCCAIALILTSIGLINIFLKGNWALTILGALNFLCIFILRLVITSNKLKKIDRSKQKVKDRHLAIDVSAIDKRCKDLETRMGKLVEEEFK